MTDAEEMTKAMERGETFVFVERAEGPKEMWTAQFGTFPKLFKKSSTGALLSWEICVIPEGEHGIIQTTHGQVGGALQTSRDTVRKGKNLGKANATTALEQAQAEAASKHAKKKSKERYVETIVAAMAGDDDAAGGIAPMLAKDYDVVKKKVWGKGASDFQRKIDGIRGLVFVEVMEKMSGRAARVEIWSRGRKRIRGLPHIEEAYCRLGQTLPVGLHIFDGDLYRHGWSLQKIQSFCAVSRTEPKEGYEEIQHYCYDLASHPGTWENRRHVHKEYLRPTADPAFGTGIVYVNYIPIDSEEEMWGVHNDVVEIDGYEGLIGRPLDGVYEQGKRSSYLFKVKVWQDAEFEIVDVHDGRGKFEGKAMFTVKNEKGQTFESTAPGSFADRADYFRRAPELVGKMLTVCYFDLTDAGIPHFGRGKAIRDDE